MAQKENGGRARDEVKNTNNSGENPKDEGSYEAWNVCCSNDEVKNNYFFIY